MNDWGVDDAWTLFLDRDGVLNRRIVGGYVLKHAQFEWLPGVLPALRLLTSRFGTTVIATNQQGVGKGLMTEEDLAAVHRKLVAQARYAGARIDAVYACTALADAGDPCRKPSPGMAERAVREFPTVDLTRAIMVGDTASDIGFARAAGMRAVFIGVPGATAQSADARFDSLYDFALALG